MTKLVTTRDGSGCRLEVTGRGSGLEGRPGKSNQDGGKRQRSRGPHLQTGESETEGHGELALSHRQGSAGWRAEGLVWRRHTGLCPEHTPESSREKPASSGESLQPVRKEQPGNRSKSANPSKSAVRGAAGVAWRRVRARTAASVSEIRVRPGFSARAHATGSRQTRHGCACVRTRPASKASPSLGHAPASCFTAVHDARGLPTQRRPQPGAPGSVSISPLPRSPHKTGPDLTRLMTPRPPARRGKHRQHGLQLPPEPKVCAPPWVRLSLPRATALPRQTQPEPQHRLSPT